MKKIETDSEIHSQFKELLKRHYDKNLVILGMGNDVMGDDQVGTWIIEQIQQRLSQCPESWHLLNVSVVPDNYVGKIIRWSPDFILMFDAYRPSQFTDTTSQPSPIIVLDSLDDLPEGFTTHNISLKNWIQFIEYHCQKKIDVQFWGILGKNFEFGNEEMSEDVKVVAEKVVKGFMNACTEEMAMESGKQSENDP